ncbi:MAG: undecaprenyl/decaprenyl-phosphate alpha-N-acetylglucosaminyl 1-phosphate transferase [Proteobacteria bacterium]|nr:undecaprenyl/decaprenyl-phosphate alpha-N-acetylglucosaminyl 1-phosphate transferase [Pseudomonadota bacterium]
MIFIICVFTLFLTLFFIWLLRLWALKIGFVDRPGGRKWHQREVPLIGGIAIFLSFYITLWIISTSLTDFYLLFISGLLVTILGLSDDFLELHSYTRLAGETVAALALFIFGNMQVSHLGNLLFLGNIKLGILALPFTLFIVVGFINAMNMIDGQDGLAGGVALGQVMLLAYLNWLEKNQQTFTQLIVLCSALVIFLFFNMRTPWRKHAAVFLGDSGSTLVALLIAWYAIQVGQNEQTVKPVVILWILAYPIYDFVQVSAARVRQGKSLLKPSPDHFHHLLHFAGMNSATSSWILTIISLSLGLAGVIMSYFQIPEGWQFITWLFTFLIYFTITQLIRKTRSVVGYRILSHK